MKCKVVPVLILAPCHEDVWRGDCTAPHIYYFRHQMEVNNQPPRRLGGPATDLSIVAKRKSILFFQRIVLRPGMQPTAVLDEESRLTLHKESSAERLLIFSRLLAKASLFVYLLFIYVSVSLCLFICTPADHLLYKFYRICLACDGSSVVQLQISRRLTVPFVAR